MSALDALFPVWRITCSDCSTEFHVLEKPGTGTCYFHDCPGPNCNARGSLSREEVTDIEEL